MPRRSGGGGGMRSGGGFRSSFGGGRSASPPRRSAAAAAPPRASPRPMTGINPGLGGIMLQGMAFGAGSEVAHQAMRGMMGSGQSQEGHNGTAPAEAVQEPCLAQNNDFMQCLQTNPEHIGMCQSYLDLYKQCRQVQQ